MNRLEVGQTVTLKTPTITPIKAKVVELGNTYVVVQDLQGRSRERIALRDAHHRIEGFMLAFVTEVTDHACQP